MIDIKQTSAEKEIENMYAEETQEENLSKPTKSSRKKGPRIFLTIVLILILVIAILLVVSKVTKWDILGLSKISNSNEIVQASDWQAVFLSNGQVYFGKLKNPNSQYPTLEDVYYLQVQDVPIQPAEPAVTEEGVQPAEQTEQQMILVKFGTELHRPMDKMHINRDHVLMFEDLRADSAVVEAIISYKESQAGE